MLKLITVKDLAIKRAWIDEINFNDSCLLVSDIKTKLSIESQILKKQEFIPGSCIMRVHEFYQDIFNSLNHEWQIVSDAFIKELFLEFRDTLKNKENLNSQNPNSFFKFFNMFLPSLLDKNNSHVFLDWFSESKNTILWKDQFFLSQEFFSFLESKKLMHESGKKSLIFYQLSLGKKPHFKKQNIYVDLSFSLELCEKEIFKELSKFKNIHIIAPQLTCNMFQDAGVDLYQNYQQEISSDQTSSLDQTFKKTDLSKPKQASYFKTRNNTQLEELKQACIQICRWLGQGIDPNDISLLAPNMEDYWFALNIFCEKQNIPIAKSSICKIKDFPEILYFLAGIRIHLNVFNFSDLETFFFYPSNPRYQGDFHTFKQDYFHVPKRDLLNKHLLQDKKLSANKKLTGSQFIYWIESFYPQDRSTFFKEIIFKVFLKFPLNRSLSAVAWFRILESEILSLDIELEKKLTGISCLSFNACLSSRSSYVYIMGLNEQAVKTDHAYGLSLSESQDILNNLGVVLNLSSEKSKENMLLWFLQSSLHKEVYLSYFVYDFTGRIHLASLIYFLSEFLFCAKSISSQGELYWDAQRQKNTIDAVLAGSLMQKNTITCLKQAFKPENHAIFYKNKPSLSPSKLKLYQNCPFKLAARYLFLVQDEPLTDVEISASLKGSLMHDLFENILTKYPSLTCSEQQKEDLINELKPDDKKLVYKQQWSIIKARLHQLCARFLKEESLTRKTCPSLKVRALEQDMKVYWDQNQACLSSKGDYVFKGKIDRIDQDEDQEAYVIRDYKSSTYALTNLPAWIKENKEDLQLIFYAQAIDKNLISGFLNHPVAALFYAVYSKELVLKGFIQKDHPLHNISPTKALKQASQTLHQAIKASNIKTQKLVSNMEQGRFLPKPLKATLCEKCHCKSWCRVEYNHHFIQENI